jgi:uncharacterized membrane protein YciS (DUF1049 family)
MFMVAMAEFFGIALVVVAIGLTISWLIRSATNAKIKVDTSTARRRVDDDLMRRLDELRPPVRKPLTPPENKH